MESYERFPIVQYQPHIASRIIIAVDTLFQKNEMLATPPTKTRKSDRSPYPKDDVFSRLGLLSTYALLAVIERIDCFLSRLKDEEKKILQNDPIKAAAYRLVLLPQFHPEAVRIFAKRLSRETLPSLTVIQLLGIHGVADYLGSTSIAEECIHLLSSAVVGVMEQSKAAGLTLTDLINDYQPHEHKASDEDDPLSTPHVVGEIFSYTMSVMDPPAELQTLVVDAITECDDDDLVVSLVEKMSSNMKGELALAYRRKAKRSAKGKKKTGSKHGQVPSADTSGVPGYLKSQAYLTASTDEATKKEMSVKKEKWNALNSEENDRER